MTEPSISIGNVLTYKFAPATPAGSSSSRIAPNLCDSGMSAPSRSNEISSRSAQLAQSEVIFLSDGDDSGLDDAPVPRHSSRHPASKKVEASHPQTSREHSKHGDVQQRVTRSQANRATSNVCLDVDDRNEAHPHDFPGSKERKRETSHGYPLTVTAGISAHDLYGDARSSVEDCDSNDSLQQSVVVQRQTDAGHAAQNAQRQTHLFIGRRLRTPGKPAEKPYPRALRDVPDERKVLDDEKSSDGGSSKEPPIKRHRRITNSERVSSGCNFRVTSNNPRSHSSDSGLTYNPESLQVDRARRSGTTSDIDVDEARTLRDKRASSSLLSKRYDAKNRSDTVRAASTAPHVSEYQQTSRRSQRVRNTAHASKEQREAARELVELDSFTVNEPYTGPTYTIFVFPPGKRGSITVTVEERKRLKERLYLNDSLIDFYIKYLQMGLQSQARCPENVPFFYSSFFFKRMIQKRPIDYSGVKSWTKDIDIFKRKYIFVPICDSYHWSLIIIINLHSLKDLLENGADSMDTGSRPKIIYMDSLDPERGSEFGSKIIHYLSEEYHHRKSNDERSASELSNQRCRKINKLVRILKPRVPIQSNEYDCGLYLLQCLKLFVSDGYFQKRVIDEEDDLENAFSHTEVEQLRKDICDLMDRLQQNWDRRTSIPTSLENKNVEVRDSRTVRRGVEVAESLRNADFSEKADHELKIEGQKNASDLDAPMDVDQIDTVETRKAEISDESKLNLSGSDSAKSPEIVEKSNSTKMVISTDEARYDADIDVSPQPGFVSSIQRLKADKLSKDLQGSLESTDGKPDNIEVDAGVSAVVDLSEESASEKAVGDDHLVEDEGAGKMEGYAHIRINVFTQGESSCKSTSAVDPTDDTVMVVEPPPRSEEYEENWKAVRIDSESENARHDSQLAQPTSSETMNLVDDIDCEEIEVSSVQVGEPAAISNGEEEEYEMNASKSQVVRGAIQIGRDKEINADSFNDSFIAVDHAGAQCEQIIEERAAEESELLNSSRPFKPPLEGENVTDVAPESTGANVVTGNADVQEVEVQPASVPRKYGGNRRRQRKGPTDHLQLASNVDM